MSLTGNIETLFLDNPSSLTGEAGSVRQWVKYKLGAPILEVELKDEQIDANFEEAVMIYSSEISKFKAKNSYTSLIGISKTSDLSKMSPMPSLNFIKRYLAQFGTEAGAGGLVNYTKGYIETVPYQSKYNLRNVLNTTDGQKASINGSLIPAHVYHFKYTGYRFYDPMMGGNYLLSQQFGMDGAYQVNSKLLYAMPLYENLIRFQWFENFDKLFKSQYKWNIVGDELYVSPTPRQSFKLFMEWTDSATIDKVYGDYLSNFPEESLTGLTTDVTNIPFKNLDYQSINDFSKNWIRQYTLALSKESLGLVRGKMMQLPIPDGELSLNYAELLVEGRESQGALKQEIREFLDSIISSESLKREGEILDVTKKYLDMTPLKIYVR